MQKKSVLRKNANMVARVIGDETVLLPVYKSSREINSIYTLNKDASRLWEMIDGKTTPAEIKKRLVKEFDTTAQETDKIVEALLKDLKKIKALM